MGTLHGHPKAETQGAPALLHRSEIGLPQQFSMLFGQGSNLVDPGFGVAPVEYTVWIGIMRDTLAVGRMDHLVQKVVSESDFLLVLIRQNGNQWMPPRAASCSATSRTVSPK